LAVDTYCVDPVDGAVDPLGDLWLGGFGGIRSEPILGAEPHRIVRELTEYLRFDRPGRYRLFVIANRIAHQPSATTRTDGKDQPLVRTPATSNIVEFTIQPADAAWARERLRKAVHTLATVPAGDSRTGPEAARYSAIRTVQLLRTEDALRYMVHHFGEAIDGDLQVGLYGFPSRAMVVKEMERGLEEPTTTVSDAYLDVLCRSAQLQLLGPPPSEREWAEREDARQQEEARGRTYIALRANYLQRLAAAVWHKNRHARAVSLFTLLTATSREPSDTQPPLPAELVRRMPQEVARLFFDLPEHSQRSLLERQELWARVKGPAMVPVLERCYARSRRDAFNRGWGAEPILRRLEELDPARARALMLEEIAAPTGRVGYKVLASLPDATLPGMDRVFSAALEVERCRAHAERCALTAQLVARYGTPAVLPQVRQALSRDDDLFHGLPSALIAYLLRVDPRLGAEALDRALSPEARLKPGFDRRVLESVARYHVGPKLEAAAIRHLEDVDLDVVGTSVDVLRQSGSTAAKGPLWRRFEQWHDDWQARAAALQTQSVVRNPEIDMGRRLEAAFVEALSNARGWLADPAELRRIQALCLTELWRRQVEYKIEEAAAPEKPLSLQRDTDGRFSLSVAEQSHHGLPSLDAVRAKLAQFPKGTVFLWRPYAGQDAEAMRALFEDLRAYLAGLGIRLQAQAQARATLLDEGSCLRSSGRSTEFWATAGGEEAAEAEHDGVAAPMTDGVCSS
jgi:hypothetical protein